jgi:hypothetical protein
MVEALLPVPTSSHSFHLLQGLPWSLGTFGSHCSICLCILSIILPEGFNQLCLVDRVHLLYFVLISLFAFLVPSILIKSSPVVPRHLLWRLHWNTKKVSRAIRCFTLMTGGDTGDIFWYRGKWKIKYIYFQFYVRFPHDLWRKSCPCLSYKTGSVKMANSKH